MIKSVRDTFEKQNLHDLKDSAKSAESASRNVRADILCTLLGSRVYLEKIFVCEAAVSP
jgi:hypothetical protein